MKYAIGVQRLTRLFQRSAKSQHPLKSGVVVNEDTSG